MSAQTVGTTEFGATASRLTIGHRFGIMIGAFVVGLAIFTALALRASTEVAVNGPIYNGIAANKDLVADILPPPAFAIEPYLAVLQLQAAKDRKELGGRIESLSQEFERAHEGWGKRLPAGPLADAAAEAHRTGSAFLDVVRREVLPPMLAGNDAAGRPALAKAATLFKAHREAIDRLSDLGTKAASAGEAEARASLGAFVWRLLLLAGLIALGVALFAGALARRLQRSLRELASQAALITDGVSEGKLDVRGDESRVDAEFRPIVEGMNRTMDAFAKPLAMTVEYVTRTAKGDIPPKIAEEYLGDFNKIKGAFNACIEAVNALVADAAMLAGEAVEGKLATRADASRHQGEFRKIIEGVNHTLDAVVGPLSVAARSVDEIARGSIPAKIVGDYRGDFAVLKENLNTCIEAVNALVADAGMLARTAVEGRLLTRADPTRHRGEFKRIIEGVNATIATLVGHLDAIPAPSMIIDKQFNIQYANQAIARLVGKSQQELIGQKCSDQFCTSDCGTGRCAPGRAMREGGTMAGETVAHPNGKELEIAYWGIPLSDGRGNIIGAFECAMDQTAAKRAAQVARKIADYQARETDRVTAALDRLSRGETKLTVTAENGDADTERAHASFAAIGKAIERCAGAVNAVVADAEALSVAAVEGRLLTRADVTRHQGDFKRIIEGVNATIGTLVGHLDAVPAPSMIIDREFNIQYINQAGALLVGKSGEDLVGKKCFDQFCASDCRTERCVPGRAMSEGGVANGETHAQPNGKDLEIAYWGVPLRDPTGKTIGAFECAIDQTAVKRAVRVSKKIADYQARETDRVTAALDSLSQGETKLAVAVENGDEDTGQAHASFATIGKAIERCAGAVDALVADAEKLSVAAMEGKLSTRADAAKHQGNYRKVIDGVNRTLDSVVGPLSAAARCVDALSKGAIPPKITERWTGDFAVLEENLNRCIEAVNALVADVKRLAAAAVQGNLSTRAEPGRHLGDFRRIVEGVNETLDAIAAPVNEAAGVLEMLSQRDLRARMSGDYQGDHARIKESLNATAKALHEALVQVADSAEQVSNAAGQIASSSQTVAAGASQQASSLEETSASLEAITSMTRQATGDAQQANALAKSARGAATAGTAAMEQMQNAMAKIRSAAEGTSQIIKDINDITFQTNLLALNAAVEAARAGEAGRGFAVVAEEVRSLALRSKEAATKTEELIRQSVREAEEGAKMSKDVSGKLLEIADAVGKVTDIVGGIAGTAKEQAAAIQQVTETVSQMDRVTQQNAASSEESSSAAQELSGQSEELAAMVGAFRLDRATGTGKLPAYKNAAGIAPNSRAREGTSVS